MTVAYVMIGILFGLVVGATVRAHYDQEYLFPPNRRAFRATPEEQLEKIQEELDELVEAHSEGKLMHILEESNDLICAVEGYQRNYNKNTVMLSRSYVKAKGQKRKDWIHEY